MVTSISGAGSHLIVGLSAPVGALSQLQEFLAVVPRYAGLSLVVLSDLPAEAIASCISRTLQVVHEPMRVAPGHLYLAPIESRVAIRGGVLHLNVPTSRPPIDSFLSSLAEEQQEQAVGVLFFGAEPDGVLGLREIRAAGGLALADHRMAQDGADWADAFLPARALAERLLARANAQRAQEIELVLDSVLQLLRSARGYDLGGYKRRLLHRGIEDRMRALRLHAVPSYLQLLERDPSELERLAREVLIGVTSFFRDPDAFDALENALPRLLVSELAARELRVWVAGCSTGEEAYSIAVVLRGLIGVERFRAVKIFATDAVADALAVARTALYSERLARDVSSQLRPTLFEEVNGRLRIQDGIRRQLIFAVHNLLVDPPLSHIDLLVCRNLLIYLQPEQQQKVIAQMRYALRPGGLLFLGPTETLGASASWFEVVDQRWKISRRRDVTAASSASLGPVTAAHTLREPDRFYRLVDRALMRELVPPCVVIQESGEVVYRHGQTGPFLQPCVGHPGRADIFALLPEPVGVELAGSIEAIRGGAKQVLCEGLIHDDLVFDLRVQPVRRPSALLLLSFERPRARSLVEDDLRNLLEHFECGAIFLDRDLRVRRFNARAKVLLDELAIGNYLHSNVIASAAREVLVTNTSQAITLERCSFRLSPYFNSQRSMDGVLVTLSKTDEPLGCP